MSGRGWREHWTLDFGRGTCQIDKLVGRQATPCKETSCKELTALAASGSPEVVVPRNLALCKVSSLQRPVKTQLVWQTAAPLPTSGKIHFHPLPHDFDRRRRPPSRRSERCRCGGC